jgi:hypothetical protein
MSEQANASPTDAKAKEGASEVDDLASKLKEKEEEVKELTVCASPTLLPPTA